MRKRVGFAVAAAAVVLVLCSSCGKKEETAGSNQSAAEEVTLTICGPWTSCKAIETVSKAFYEKYPNCNVVYEFVQNYEESLSKRLENAPESVDLFLTENIQADSAYLQYAEELFAHSELDLSNTYEAFIRNFTLINADPEAEKQIYSIPLGGELRGLYVNKTLLSSLGLEVPTNKEELLAACEVLKEAGYVPMNGNPGMFGQRLMYPYIANLIVNSDDYQKTYDRVNQCEEGISELFREPMEFVYDLSKNYYYNYKYVETELNMFTDNSDESCARYFFNVTEDGEDFKKVDDVGTVAFMVGTYSQQPVLEKTKEDYHSEIDYEFVLAPVSEEGGYAYLSPAKGIAVNKNSHHLDEAVSFVNYLFTEEGNTKFAEESAFIPNTKDSVETVREKFDVTDDHVSDLGQMTFDYAFYNIIDSSLVNISKSNNPKYMDTDKDGNTVMYSFDSYMEQLEAAFAEQRK